MKDRLRQLGPESDPIAALAEHERAAILAAVALMLKPDEQRMLRLRYENGMTTDEIASCSAISGQAIRRRFTERIYPRMRAELETRGITAMRHI